MVRATLGGILLGGVLLSGCAEAPDRAEILVNTAPPGASCVLTRLGQPIASAAPTPAIELVAPDAGDITVACRRRGYADAAVTLPVKPGAVVGEPWVYEHRVDIALLPAPR